MLQQFFFNSIICLSLFSLAAIKLSISLPTVKSLLFQLKFFKSLELSVSKVVRINLHLDCGFRTTFTFFFLFARRSLRGSETQTLLSE